MKMLSVHRSIQLHAAPRSFELNPKAPKDKAAAAAAAAAVPTIEAVAAAEQQQQQQQQQQQRSEEEEAALVIAFKHHVDTSSIFAGLNAGWWQ